MAEATQEAVTTAEPLVRTSAGQRSNLTIFAHALLLLTAEGLSIGLGVGQLLIIGGTDSFLMSNTLAPRARNFLLAMGFGCAALTSMGATLFAWRFRGRSRMASSLLRLAHRVAPLGVVAFLPLLFRWRVWQGRDLAFLTLTALASFCFGAGLRASLSTGALTWEAPLWSRVRQLSSRLLTSWPRLARRLPILIVCAGAIAYAVYFSIHTCAWYWGVRSGYDLALENNLLWNLTHRGSELFKSSPAFGPTGTHLGYHATFFAFVIAPFYWLAPRPETLLVLQSIVLGAASIPLYVYARQYLSRALSVVIALSYLLYPPLHGANLYEFHYLPLGTLFLWTTLYALETGRNKLAIVGAILCLSIREDVAAGLGIWGAYLILTGRRPRAGLVLAVISGLYFVIMKMVIMPRFAHGETFTFIFKQLLPPGETTFGSVLKTVISNPFFTIGTLIEQTKLIYFLQIFVPLAFLPLRQPIAALFVLPGFVFTLLSTGYFAVVSIYYQYTTHWTTFMFISLVILLGRMDFVRRRAAAGAMIIALLACSYQYGGVFQTNTAYGGPFPYKFVTNDEDRRRRQGMDAVLRHLPPDAKVACSALTVPQVSSRADAYSLTVGVFDAEYLLFPSERAEFIVNERATVTDLLKAGTYGVVVVAPPFALARRGHSVEKNAALLSSLQ